MLQLGRVSASVFSGVAEATLALANVNFDFSLVKVNAPIEFEGVGHALSTFRRDVAESGSTHITARKLGAVFENVIPPTPRLYEAYGRRASQIYATSIWAAATSGKAAIAVHLLACLLARFWKPAEAVSIWEEIISVRKKTLEEAAIDETFQMATILASQVSITHEQLAEWDNSARAWLGFADRAHDEQQTKLKLVIDEMQRPIATKSTLYESVIDSWTVALRGMEELLQGASQGVSHSGLILALSCWHLYPDLSVEGGAPVLQKDELFPHGTTAYLNLQGNPNTDKRGIYWSLSLSHMRFYGAPIQTERSYATGSSRISFTQFLHAVLGSTSSQWSIKSPSPLDAARIIQAIVKSSESRAPAWMRMLGVAAADMLNSNDAARLLNLKLFRIGRERGASLLADPRTHPLPVFGLSRSITVPKVLEESGVQAEDPSEVAVSPSWYAQFRPVPQQALDEKMGADPHALLDFTTQDLNSTLTSTNHEDVDDRKSQSSASTTSDSPSDAEKGVSTTANEAGGDETLIIHYPDHPALVVHYEPRFHSSLTVPFNVPEIEVSEVSDEQRISSDNDGKAETESDIGIEYISAFPVEGLIAAHSESYLHWSYRKVREEACLPLGDGHHVDFAASDHIIPDGTTITMRLDSEQRHGFQSGTPGIDGSKDSFFGDFQSGMMFVRADLIAQFDAATTGPGWARKLNLKKEIDLVDIEEAFCSDEIDLSKWVSDIDNAPEKRQSNYYRSLMALASAWNLYTDLGQATVDPAVLGKRVMDSEWTKSLKLDLHSVTDSASLPCTRQQAFACIAEFETGGIDLASSEFESVMAMSIGESIYVSGPLLTDPFEPREPDKVIRLEGNVGKSGLALMIPPAEPMISQPNPDSWRVIEREEYGGQLEDCFSRTSLHLSFTNWSVPVSTGAAGRGRRSAEALLVETLVSVFDRGKWTGDLDVLTALRRGCAQPDHEFFYCHTCGHDSPSRESEQVTDGIVAIRSWEEFLDRPNSPAVVMAHGNWEARLAAATMGVARGDRVFLCRGAVCRACLLKLESFGGEDLVNRALFIA
ncbi:hypothetical protein EDD37DRAFT_649107 [Exophiala viscosa]|uniref:uncharacterized protein n=1 Tax=Exophiala viscosa TaxID=2486360 RepID=UPI002194F2AF|nr:hypothetical protein EDD37DRAFT_649107 [Exophiala viscosa]